MSFPYKIMNDLTAKVRAAEDQILQERKYFESKIAKIVEEYEEKLQARVPIDANALLQDEVYKLRRTVADLVHSNNRYHLAVSNCTHCVSEDAMTETSAESSDESIRASTPAACNLPSSDSAIMSSSASASVSSIEDSKLPVEVDKKDEAYVDKMLKVLSKLETKYLTPTHKRKKRLFLRKKRTSHIVPREFDSIYHLLAAPEPEAAIVPDPLPYVRWNDIRFKPALPNPEQCPIHSCSPDPKFYVDKESPSFQCNYNFDYGASQYGKPFGALPGYLTNLGVVPVPSTPVGGYVFCPDAKKWVLFATTGRGIRREGPPPARRRKG